MSARPQWEIFDDPNEWSLVVEPLERKHRFSVPRWRYYLKNHFWRFGGSDGWGWTAWTYRGALRRGEAALAARQHHLRALAERRRKDNFVGPISDVSADLRLPTDDGA